ncbi:MAG: HAMP domain-containing sensor histidine kinase [Gemmatimonadales bacterium]
MNLDDEEEKLLRAVALRNADSIFLARQRAEQERDRARAEADAAHRAAREANEAKGRFVNMVSHELRTPLGAIGGYAALLEEEIHGPLSDEQRKFLARIRHNQQHLLRLVDDLLDLAKIESGQFQLKITSVRVQDVMENVCKMIEPQISESDLRFDVAPSEDALCCVADRERVEQIVLNLVANAVKFTPTGGTIAVSATGTAKEVSLHVRDTGLGIPPGRLEEVFQPFVQVESRPNATSRGTGLGLAISRELARAMGGDLSAKSEAGRGSTFTLCLPRVQ